MQYIRTLAFSHRELTILPPLFWRLKICSENCGSQVGQLNHELPISTAGALVQRHGVSTSIFAGCHRCGDRIPAIPAPPEISAVKTISSQQELLAEALLTDGWKIVDRQTNLANWLYFEIWTIESVWRPVGRKAFLTFLNDPMPGAREPNAVECSSASPDDGNGPGERIAWVGFTRWKDGVEKLIESLAQFRDRPK